MYGRILSFGFRTAVAVLALTLVAAISWAGETKLHNFGPYPSGGAGPNAPLISDANGNLYGTTSDGGTHVCANPDNYCGTIFQMTPNGNGTYTFTKLHNFGASSTDATVPSGSLIMDASGNIYGTSYSGGSHANKGTVYQMTPNGSGGFSEKVLHNFGVGNDGANPYAGLIMDAAGNMYGTTLYGGRYNGGTVFEMTPNGSGGWTESPLYHFNPASTNGAYPLGGLVMDASGNLYGTTFAGGNFSCGFQSKCGTVFELSPSGGGGWTIQKLHDFQDNNQDGYSPHAGLTFDSAGNLYGTTTYGGAFNAGVVFQFATDGNGGWTENILYSFGNGDHDGKYPLGTVVLDPAGNVYSTTSDGGGNLCNSTGCGTAFELQVGQSWAERKLHNFGSGTDGYTPQAGLLIDASGDLYGTTYYGGNNNTGTVFEIVP